MQLHTFQTPQGILHKTIGGTKVPEDRKHEILSVIAEEVPIDLAMMDDETTVADLGISSLDLIEIIFKIEGHYGIAVPSDGPFQSTDVKISTLVEQVEKLLDAQGSSAAKSKA